MVRMDLAYALCALLISTPAFAETKAGADAQAVANCVEKAKNSGRSGSDCIGVVADPCIAAVQEGPEYNKEAGACASRELAVWNKRMLAALKKAKAGEEFIRAGVESAQKNWTSSQNALCATFDDLDPGMAPGGNQYCRLLDTAQHTLILEKLVGAIVEH